MVAFFTNTCDHPHPDPRDPLGISRHTLINHQAISLWHNVHMSDERTLTLHQADQARTDFALIESNLEFIAGPALAAAHAGGLSQSRARDHYLDGGARHPVGGSVLALLMGATAVPGAEHYREIADKLREAASSCQFAGARKEILHLAADSRAEPIISIGGRDRRPRRACADPRCPEAGLMHRGNRGCDRRRRALGEGIPIARGDVGIPTRASLPVRRAHERPLPRLPQGSRKAARLRRTRRGLEPSMANHPRCQC